MVGVSLCAPEGINQQDGVCAAAKTKIVCQAANGIGFKYYVHLFHQVRCSTEPDGCSLYRQGHSLSKKEFCSSICLFSIHATVK